MKTLGDVVKQILEAQKPEFTKSLEEIRTVSEFPGSVRHRGNYAKRPEPIDDESMGYQVGDLWVDANHMEMYICVDSTKGSAVWKLVINV